MILTVYALQELDVNFIPAKYPSSPFPSLVARSTCVSRRAFRSVVPLWRLPDRPLLVFLSSYFGIYRL